MCQLKSVVLPVYHPPTTSCKISITVWFLVTGETGVSSHLTSWSSAALLTEYPTKPGTALMPATLETWMTFPWLEVRWGLVALVSMKADLQNN